MSTILHVSWRPILSHSRARPDRTIPTRRFTPTRKNAPRAPASRSGKYLPPVLSLVAIGSNRQATPISPSLRISLWCRHLAVPMTKTALQPSPDCFLTGPRLDSLQMPFWLAGEVFTVRASKCRRENGDLNTSLGIIPDKGAMAKAIALTRTHLPLSVAEFARTAMVSACGLALVFAGPALPL